MLDAALEPLQEIFPGRVLVNDFEKTLEPPTYSYKLLNLIRKSNPNDDLYIVCGDDIIPAIKDWKEFDKEIQPYFKYIKFSRDNSDSENNISKASEPFYNEEIKMEGINVTKRKTETSSTIIRNMIRDGLCPYPLVNKGVFDIIKMQGLYGFKR